MFNSDDVMIFTVVLMFVALYIVALCIFRIIKAALSIRKVYVERNALKVEVAELHNKLNQKQLSMNSMNKIIKGMKREIAQKTTADFWNTECTIDELNRRVAELTERNEKLLKRIEHDQMLFDSIKNKECVTNG